MIRRGEEANLITKVEEEGGGHNEELGVVLDNKQRGSVFDKEGEHECHAQYIHYGIEI